MKKKYISRLAILALATFGSLFFILHNSVPDNVSRTLKAAGANEQELRKVVTYYQNSGEKKKIEAAYFLLANMQDMFHSEGEAVDRYKLFFRTVDSLEITDRNFRKVWDSLVNVYKPEKLGEGKLVNDIATLNSDLLIRHIDAAFEAWNYPWAKHLNFESFCEYILPYKIADENPELWISTIQQKYRWLHDSMGTSDNPVIACLLLNKALHKNHWINSLFASRWDFNYSDLDKVFGKIHTRGCAYSVQYSAYVLRSMGIPVAIDFTPYWANRSGGHEWNALILDGKPLPFVGTESDPGKTKVEAAFSRKRAKIFRRSFSVQENSPFQFAKTETDIPRRFRSRHLLDVTSHYEPVSEVRIKLDRDISTSGIAYLCVYNGSDWKPVHWGQVDKKGYVNFRDMGRGIAYLPVYCEDEQLIPAGPPLILQRSGSIDILSADKKSTEAIVVKSKSFDGVKIAKGKEWELLYWNPVTDWISLGKKTATSSSLEFENVPQNALFIIHSNEKPETERIFTYENGDQKFW